MKKYIFIIIISLPLFSAAADITVEITPIELGEGMAQLEAMVNSETADAAEDLQIFISDYTVKPLLFKAMSASGITTASILPLSMPASADFAAFTGTAASFTSDNFNVSEMEVQLSEFAIEDDLYLGASLQAFSVCLKFPADFLFDGLSLTAGLGYLAFDYNPVNISSSNLHISSSYNFFNNNSDSPVNWTGLHLQGGFTLSTNTLTAIYPMDMSQTIELDPDGAGPIVPFNITIVLSPDVIISYRNTQLSIPAAISTGVNLIDTFSFRIGAGSAFTVGQNEIGVEVNDEINVAGFLSDLIETSPRVVVSGTNPGSKADIISFFIFGTFSFNTGGFYLNIPVSWNFIDTVTTGITFGAAF